MHPEYIATGAAVLSSVVVGLIAWGNRGQVATLQQTIETLRQEFGKNMAEAELRIIRGINGTYTRTPLHMDLVARVDRIEGRVDEIT
jgi:hypothetical protein